MFYSLDPLYLILVVPTMLLSLFAQFKVKSTFAKYSKVASRAGKTGREVADIVLRSSGINYVGIEPIGGSLTDHFDPRSKKLRLSEPVYGQISVAAAGVAAHEAGHAIQQKVKYGPLVLRSTLVPVANIGSQFGPYIILIGMGLGSLSAVSSLSALIMQIGIILFAGAVLFYLVTLPVEINASRRAVKALSQTGLFDKSELSAVKKVLFAAAMTYIASALSSVAMLLRFILMSRRRRR